MTVVEVSSNSDDLGAAPQIVPEPERPLDQLQLKEVVSAAVVRIQEQSVGLVSLELQLQTAVGGRVPLPEPGVRVLTPVEHEPCHRGPQYQCHGRRPHCRGLHGVQSSAVPRRAVLSSVL